MGWGFTGIVDAGGAASWQDTATEVTPIGLTAGVWTPMTNNALGELTFNNLPFGVDDLWDPVAGAFDFSSLPPINFRATLRADLVAIAVGSNAVFDVRFRAGDGGPGPFNLPMAHEEYKAAGTYNITAEVPFYTAGSNLTDWPALIQATRDNNNSSIWVRDWYLALER